jgi:hypothetical protein
LLQEGITTGTSPANPKGITPGPDGNIWFVEFTGNRVARVTVTVPAPRSTPALPAWAQGVLASTLLAAAGLGLTRGKRKSPAAGP